MGQLCEGAQKVYTIVRSCVEEGCDEGVEGIGFDVKRARYSKPLFIDVNSHPCASESYPSL